MVIIYKAVARYARCHSTPTDEWPINWPVICGHGMAHGTVNIRMT